MVDPKKIFFSIKKRINFFVGVPDSVLKNFLKLLDLHDNKISHYVAANEGTAVSMGIGHYLSTNNIPCVYLQNSGLGNSINPLISIAHKSVYSIPILLLIGWRGSPKTTDEPQHLIKGKITIKLLKILGIKYLILNSDKDINKINKIINFAKKNNVTVAILIKKDSLKSEIYPTKKKNKITNKFKRYDFIKSLLLNIKKNDKIISTTGYTSRELFQIRQSLKIKNGRDFYMVGGMGHALSVTLGYLLSSKKKIICLDGDGSIIMHLGSMHSAGVIKSKNLKHILLNNGIHESVGGQTTYSDNINFKILSKSLGYKNYILITSKNRINEKIKKFLSSQGPSLLEVKISKGNLKNLIRPKNLIKLKNHFLKK